MIDKLSHDLVAAGVVSHEDPVVGLHDDEIARLENCFKLDLPYAYKEFLRKMGRHTGNFLRDFVITYPHIIFYHDSVKRILEENGIELSSSAFVFAETQGEGLLYFDTSSDDSDPPVFLVSDGETEKIFDSFSEWLKQIASEDIESWNDPELNLREAIAENDADPSIQKVNLKLAQSKFHVGTAVQLIKDLPQQNARLCSESKTDLKAGQIGTVFSVQWRETESKNDSYNYFVEFADDSKRQLLALCVIDEESLQIAQQT